MSTSETSIKVIRDGRTFYVATSDDSDILTENPRYARRFWDGRALEEYRNMMATGRTRFRPLPSDIIDVVPAIDRGY